MIHLARRMLPVGAVAALLLLHAAPRPLTAGPPATPPTLAIAELQRQAEAWDQAIVRKDRPAIEANMAEDFRGIDGAGTVSDRRGFVDGLVAAKLEIEPYTVEDFDVRLYGDVALLSGRTRMTGRYEGKAFTSHYRYIDVYVRRAGHWRVVSVQVTKIG